MVGNYVAVVAVHDHHHLLETFDGPFEFLQLFCAQAKTVADAADRSADDQEQAECDDVLPVPQCERMKWLYEKVVRDRGGKQRGKQARPKPSAQGNQHDDWIKQNEERRVADRDAKSVPSDRCSDDRCQGKRVPHRPGIKP